MLISGHHKLNDITSSLVMTDCLLTKVGPSAKKIANYCLRFTRSHWAFLSDLE